MQHYAMKLLVKVHMGACSIMRWSFLSRRTWAMQDATELDTRLTYPKAARAQVRSHAAVL